MLVKNFNSLPVSTEKMRTTLSGEWFVMRNLSSEQSSENLTNSHSFGEEAWIVQRQAPVSRLKSFTVRSSLPVKTCSPLLEKTALVTMSVWPLKSWMSLPVSVLQTPALLPELAERRFLEGWQQTKGIVKTSSASRLRVLMRAPVVSSQKRTSLSALSTVRTVVPSAATAMPAGSSSGPPCSKLAMASPVAQLKHLMPSFSSLARTWSPDGANMISKRLMPASKSITSFAVARSHNCSLVSQLKL
mmetsp:Transcript_17205/g.37016  ORF Transcript_17205/g.37016 Transcript_17205/m.37016 type:complete len:245 (-) Transcript_17205:257-991(-)